MSVSCAFLVGSCFPAVNSLSLQVSSQGEVKMKLSVWDLRCQQNGGKIWKTELGWPSLVSITRAVKCGEAFWVGRGQSRWLDNEKGEMTTERSEFLIKPRPNAELFFLFYDYCSYFSHSFVTMCWITCSQIQYVIRWSNDDLKLSKGVYSPVPSLFSNVMTKIWRIGNMLTLTGSHNCINLLTLSCGHQHPERKNVP